MTERRGAAQVDELEIVSVNVGRPAVLLARPSGDIVSGIDKRPVGGPTLLLTETNLEGDGQADTKESRFGGQVHGGPDQAVYAFPAEHYARFEATLERAVGPGFVGENLTVRGATEAEVRIGDVWAWGEALLQVSLPPLAVLQAGHPHGAPGAAPLGARGGAGGLVPARPAPGDGAHQRAHRGGGAPPGRGHRAGSAPRDRRRRDRAGASAGAATPGGKGAAQAAGGGARRHRGVPERDG